MAELRFAGKVVPLYRTTPGHRTRDRGKEDKVQEHDSLREQTQPAGQSGVDGEEPRGPGSSLRSSQAKSGDLGAAAQPFWLRGDRRG